MTRLIRSIRWSEDKASPGRLRIRPQKRLKIKSVPSTELKSLRERYFFYGYLVPGKVPRSFCLTDCGCFKRRVSPATIVMKSEIKEDSGRWSSLVHVPLSGMICCLGRYNFKKQPSVRFNRPQTVPEAIKPTPAPGAKSAVNRADFY